MKNVILQDQNKLINVNNIGRFVVTLSIFKIASSKWKCNTSFSIARISSCHISKFKLALSEFGETYLSETACPVLLV